jgi:CheY-like chemotaxis protein
VSVRPQVDPCHVLVIDDEAPVRHLVTTILRRAGHEVVAAASGEDGLAALDASYDVVVTDLVMPGVGGLEVMRRARERFPEVGVVLMTGAGNPAQLEKARAAGAVVVEKPFAHATIVDAVAALLGGS